MEPTEPMTEYPIFSNGTEFRAWEEGNCYRCRRSGCERGDRDEYQWGRCDLQDAIVNADLYEGRIPLRILTRFGGDGEHSNLWQVAPSCPEREEFTPPPWQSVPGAWDGFTVITLPESAR
jgi:hypothetical protein